MKESKSSAQLQQQVQVPAPDLEEDKENHFKQANVIEDQEEVKLNPKKSHKKPPPSSKKVVKEEEQFNFMPKLSKNSLMIASSLGDPLERLTSKKKTNRRTKNSSGEDHSFTPRINTKSTLIDSFRRDRSVNRFQELHEQVAPRDQAQQLVTKREKQRQTAEQEKTQKEDLACAFHPHLVTSYTPEYLNEVKFLERSYMWKKRVEQKLENQRKQKQDLEPASPGARPGPPAGPAPQLPGQRTNVAQELNEFFQLNKESVEHRKLHHKYLH